MAKRRLAPLPDSAFFALGAMERLWGVYALLAEARRTPNISTPPKDFLRTKIVTGFTSSLAPLLFTPFGKD